MKLAVFQTHPIQYCAPLWRALAARPGLDVTVFFLCDASLRGGVDREFGRQVTWDVPMLGGYRHRFIKREGDPSSDRAMRIPDLGRLFREGSFDCALVPGYSRPYERQLLWRARRAGVRVIMRGEFAPPQGGNPAKNLLRAVYRRLAFSRVDAFAVIGAQAREELLNAGVAAEKLFFSPYAVDGTLFRRRGRASVTRASLGLAKDDVVALFSGKLIPRKSPETLLHALERFGDFPKMKAIFMGDGPMSDELKARAARTLKGRVLFPGFLNQSAMPDYFALADIFVLPSRYDTWGLVVNEALQMGLPVVCSDKVGCARDLVRPGVNGAVFPAGDADALADSLRILLEDRPLRRRYGKAGSKIVLDYSVERAAKGILEAAIYACGKPAQG